MSGLNPPGPLAYSGQVAVPSIQRNFAPTTTDINFNVPTVWTFPSAKKAYILVNKELGVADWLLFATSAGPIDFFTTDDGHTVDPLAGNVNLAGGANITTSSVDLSDTATFSLSGTTDHAVQIGNSGGSLTSLGVGTNGQVLLGATGADPAFAALTSLDGSVTYTTGANALDLSVNTSSFLNTLTSQSGTATASAGNINVFGAGSITTIASGSTLTAELTGLTNHAVLVGAGTTTITKVGPNSASGIPLISQGSSSDPVFGTALVPGGGTGDTSFTAYSVICGGTTSIGALQNVVGVGNSGQVLTSNGAAALPTWQAASGGSAITTIDGDTGSVTGTTITLTGDSTGLTFSGSGTTMTLGGDLNVAHGGTGIVTTTAYGVLTGGTTATGPFQNAGTGTTGQVLTSNGSSALPTWQSIGVNNLQITLDAGTSPISPTADVLVFTGAQVATGVVGANVIRTDGTAANTMAIQIQRTTTSGVTNSTLNGVCHFSSTNFSVDANGFVTFVGGSSSFPWTDEGGNFNGASNNGYFTTATLTATLPPTPANGDIIRVVVDTTQITTLQANTGQKIRIGNVISSSAGTAVNTRQGDSIDLVYRSASATWYAFSGTVGTWGVT